MFINSTSENRPSLVWLALPISVALHLFLAVGLSAVNVPVPSPYVVPDGERTPTVAVQVESVDEVHLDS